MFKHSIVILLISGLFASGERNFDRFQTNIFINYDKSNTTIGHRWYPYPTSTFDQYTQIVFRYDLQNSPYRFEYRWIEKATRSEDWYRFQWKNFKWKNLWYTSRFEHRRRLPQKDNIFRYRPQFGIKGKVYIIIEPHVQYTYNIKELKYSHMQTFIGFELFKNNNIKIKPFLEIDTDENYKFNFMFLGIDLKWSVNYD